MNNWEKILVLFTVALKSRDKSNKISARASFWELPNVKRRDEKDQNK